MTNVSEQARPSTPLAVTPAALQAHELLSRAKQPRTLLIDVRSRREFNHAHVPGSQSIPAGWLLAGEPPEGDLVLIGRDSLSSQQLIEQLHEQGYNLQLQYLDGGFTAWVAGTNRDPMPLQFWRQALISTQQLIAGPLLLITAAATQSIGLLALGFVLLFSPWTLRRGRA